MPVPRKTLSNAPTIQAPQPRALPQDTGTRRLPGAIEVPLEQLAADHQQPRRDWSHGEGETRIEELAASIREFGILQPLLVREEGALADGRQRYVIIAGGRRYVAAQRAGLTLVPVVVRGEEPARIRFLQLIENLQRQDLSPLDEARAYQELLDYESLTPPSLAARLHLSAQHVRDRLRLLADQVLADAVERRQISASAAREIMKLPDDEVLSFRARVSRGEQLQINDVATARARLAAEGVTNARRKGPARPVRAVQLPQPSQPAGGLAEAQKQTMFVANGKQTVQPIMETGAVAAQVPPIDVKPWAMDSSPAGRIKALLMRCLPEDRLLFMQALAIGAAEDWSCEALRAHLESAD